MESKIITGNLRNSEELKIRVFRFSPLVWTVSREEADKQGDVIYFRNEVLNSWKSLADVVEEAISSIVQVGIRLSKSNEAKWLAEQLRTVQQFGKKFSAASQSRHPSEIGQMCAFLYIRESFWYKFINSILRNPNTITYEHIKTFGPFCWLLDRYVGGHGEEESMTVYRGMILSDEQRKEFMREDETVTFASFTSTTKSRTVAEMYSRNSFLIIDIRGSPHGKDISSLSNFPDEEEYLLWKTSIVDKRSNF
jgi:hypothetical protein